MTQEDPHTNAAQAVEEGRPIEAQYARQGRGGVRIIGVLLGGLVLVGIAFAIIWGLSGSKMKEMNANDGDQAVDARAFQGAAQDPAPTPDVATGARGEPGVQPSNAEPANVNAQTNPQRAQ